MADRVDGGDDDRVAVGRPFLLAAQIDAEQEDIDALHARPGGQRHRRGLPAGGDAGAGLHLGRGLPRSSLAGRGVKLAAGAVGNGGQPADGAEKPHGAEEKQQQTRCEQQKQGPGR